MHRPKRFVLAAGMERQRVPEAQAGISAPVSAALERRTQEGIRRRAGAAGDRAAHGPEGWDAACVSGSVRQSCFVVCMTF